MLLTVLELLALGERCAPAIAPETLVPLVQVESGRDPLAIGVNGPSPRRPKPRSASDAAAQASALIAAGHSVDLGLGQINSRNLGWLGLTVAEAFQPCANLAAAARVLQQGYAASEARTAGEQAALRAALSRYNTGHATRGLRNGYVARVTAAAGRLVPALRVAGTAAPARPTADDKLAPGPSAAPSPTADADPIEAASAPPPAWDVFARAAAGARPLLIRLQPRDLP